MDWQAKRLEGKIFTVRFIDSTGQIHLEETVIAHIPGVDEYELVKYRYWKKGLDDASVLFSFFTMQIMRMMETYSGVLCVYSSGNS